MDDIIYSIIENHVVKLRSYSALNQKPSGLVTDQDIKVADFSRRNEYIKTSKFGT